MEAKNSKMEKAIYVYDRDTQKKVFETYGAEVPFYMVYYPKEGFYNSPLYFEMYHPDLEIVK